MVSGPGLQFSYENGGFETMFSYREIRFPANNMVLKPWLRPESPGIFLEYSQENWPAQSWGSCDESPAIPGTFL